MKLLNLGSINIDHVYQMDGFVRPGETKNSLGYQCFAGGKGCNQSVALARAGSQVSHAGKIGQEGKWIHQLLAHEGVDTQYIQTTEHASGHAIIQVNQQGENAIILHGGANQSFTQDDILSLLNTLSPGDGLLLQNEINLIRGILDLAFERSIRIFFNPAPMSQEVAAYPLQYLDHLFVNEIEGEQLTEQKDPDKILLEIHARYPNLTTVLTLGADGVMVRTPEKLYTFPAKRVHAVDTTAAGDTFIGYYLAGLMRGLEISSRVQLAIEAAAICVTRPGATDSIPYWREVWQ